MRVLLLPIVAAGLVLAGCATSFPSQSEAPPALFADALFGPPTEQVGRQQIFEVSDDMRRFAFSEMLPLIRKYGVHGALVRGLYGTGRLKLEYESTVTRNAAEAFEARAGNCLSLVIMTAAFARELGLQVSYQSAYLEQIWSRKWDLLILNGHVNVRLAQRPMLARRTSSFGAPWAPHDVTIDFLPQEDLRNLKTIQIPESLVVAMFMNNRSVEALVQGRLDDAYAWARELSLAAEASASRSE